MRLTGVNGPQVPLTGVVGNAEMTEGSVALRCGPAGRPVPFTACADAGLLWAGADVLGANGRVRKEGEMGSLTLGELKSRVLQAIALNVPFVDTKPSAV